MGEGSLQKMAFAPDERRKQPCKLTSLTTFGCIKPMLEITIVWDIFKSQ